MAFTGTATKTYLGKNICIITGLSLGIATSGTIGNSTSSADEKLRSTFPTLTANSKVTVVKVASAPVISISKGGTPIIATLTNTSGAALSGALEIWVENIHSEIA